MRLRKEIDMGQARLRKLSGNYPYTKPTGKPVWEKHFTMVTFVNRCGETIPCSLEEFYDANRSDDLVALHEASHAVAAWVLDLPLTGMLWVNPDEAHPGLRKRARACVIQRGLADNLKKSYGEKLVLAKSTAFMEIAGVYGISGQASSLNPCHQDTTERHFWDAVKMYQALLCCQTPEEVKSFCLREAAANDDAFEEVRRLIPIVKTFFANRIIRALTQGLANLFLEKQCISGDEVYEFLNEGWLECNRIAAELETAKAEVEAEI